MERVQLQQRSKKCWSVKRNSKAKRALKVQARKRDYFTDSAWYLEHEVPAMPMTQSLANCGTADAQPSAVEQQEATWKLTQDPSPRTYPNVDSENYTRLIISGVAGMNVLPPRFYLCHRARKQHTEIGGLLHIYSLRNVYTLRFEGGKNRLALILIPRIRQAYDESSQLGVVTEIRERNSRIFAQLLGQFLGLSNLTKVLRCPSSNKGDAKTRHEECRKMITSLENINDRETIS